MLQSYIVTKPSVFLLFFKSVLIYDIKCSMSCCAGLKYHRTKFLNVVIEGVFVDGTVLDGRAVVVDGLG